MALNKDKIAAPSNKAGTLGGVAVREIVTHQEARPLVYFNGSPKLTGVHVGEIYNQRSVERFEKVRTGKGSSTRISQGFDYYGTVVYLFSNRIDVLRRVIFGEGSVWIGEAQRTGSPNPLVLNTANGDIYFYWGTDSDPQHPVLLEANNNYGHDHPPYRGVAKMVLQDYYFGRDITSAPNVEIVADSAGAQTVVTGLAAELDADGQCNPMVCLANYLTDARQGLGIDPSRLKQSSFQLAASALQLDSSLKYLTMVLEDTIDLRKFLQLLVQYVDFYLRFDADGLISVGLYPQNNVVDPGGLEELSFDDFESGDLPELIPPSFEDMGTSFYVTFYDSARDYKETALSEDNLRLFEMFGERRVESLDRSWCVRSEQARSLLSEWNRDFTQPRATGSRVVRRSILDSKGLNVGSLFKMSINPSPAGLTLVQAFKLISREDDPEGLMSEIEFEEIDADSLAVTVSGQISETPPVIDVPDLVDARIIQLPPVLSSGEPFRIGIIAQRPADSVVGYAVNYGNDTDGFYEIGLQQSFAIKGTLDSDILAADNSITIDLDSGVLDSDLQELVGPGEVAARDDALLVVLCKINAGAIAEDVDGFAVMEILSVSDVSTPVAGQRTLTVLRGRTGTVSRDFLAADTEVWILDRRTLQPFYHNDFSAGAGPTFQFRLQTFNLSTLDQTSDYLELDYGFPTTSDYAPVVLASGVINNGWLSSQEWEFVYNATLADTDVDMATAQLKITPPSGASQNYSYVADSGESGSWTISQTVRFRPEGNYTFELTVRDSNDNVTTDQVVFASGATPWANPVIYSPYYKFVSSEATIGYWLVGFFVHAPSRDLLRINISGAYTEEIFVDIAESESFAYTQVLAVDQFINPLNITVTATTTNGVVTTAPLSLQSTGIDLT